MLLFVSFLVDSSTAKVEEWAENPEELVQYKNSSEHGDISRIYLGKESTILKIQEPWATKSS